MHVFQVMMMMMLMPTLTLNLGLVPHEPGFYFVPFQVYQSTISISFS
jgi:hypothetical protein